MTRQDGICDKEGGHLVFKMTDNTLQPQEQVALYMLRERGASVLDFFVIISGVGGRTYGVRVMKQLRKKCHSLQS